VIESGLRTFRGNYTRVDEGATNEFDFERNEATNSSDI